MQNGVKNMGIISFDKLKKDNYKEVYEFIKERGSAFISSLEAMENFYLGEAFEGGTNLFLAFQGNVIVGTMGVITKEVPIKKEAFITEIYLREEFSDNSFKSFGKASIDSLLERCIIICEKCKASKITLGFKNRLKFLEPYILSRGFNKAHEAIIMKYKKTYEDVERENTNELNLIPLEESTLEEFVEVHNQAFKDTTNGANLSLAEAQELLLQYNEYRELIGIVKKAENTIGIYMLAMVDKVGWIDNIGILEKYRGKGYGKALMNKSISKLLSYNPMDIKLLVMSSNNIAYSFYMDYGFMIDEIFSLWYEKLQNNS